MSLVRRSILTRGMALAMLLVAAACDNNEPSTPSSIQGVPGQSVSGRAGQPVTVTVKVLASNGRPLAGQTVTFTPTTGTVSPATAPTDDAGQAVTVWTLGNQIGTQTLNAAVGTLTPLTISATVTAGAPATVTVQAGNNQTTAVGTTVATRPAVLVRDAGGNPVAGATVTFEVVTGNGSVTGGSATTDASGVAAVGSWQLGTQAGAQTLRATVAGGAAPLTATFTATATPGQVARLDIRGGNAVSGTVGAALGAANLPSVAVVDANGNPIPNVQVTFSVASGGGTITGATQTTNAQGIATVGGLTLGQAAGANVVTAVAAGASPANFLITGTAGPAAQTQVVSGNNQSIRAGQALPLPAQVKVVDQFGNPVAGAAVQFVVTGGGGSVLGSSQTTNAQGQASVGGWTLGTIPGTNTLAARVSGAADAVFTAIGLAGPPTQLRKISGDSQTVVAFRAAPQPFVVEVRDADNFPVRGATVTFAITSTPGGATGTGSLSATSVQTDDNGRASTTFTASSVLGQNTITASLGALTPITFTITTTSNTVATIQALSAINQSATAGGNVPDPPRVRLLDALGNPVPGVTVFFGPYTGSGTVQNTSVVTDASGIASAGQWTLSGTPGTNTLAAISSVPSSIPNSTLIFTATGISIPANATVTQIAGNPPATAAAGSSVPVAVLVKDAAGNPIAGATVNWQITGGGGHITGQAAGTITASSNTDASGIARVNWTLGTGTGVINSITAIVVNGPVVGISVTTQ
jgi:adhesin/invasin